MSGTTYWEEGRQLVPLLGSLPSRDPSSSPVWGQWKFHPLGPGAPSQRAAVTQEQGPTLGLVNSMCPDPVQAGVLRR
jgi:hypothetical protein